ncbi:MAG TPA: tetratricopeptide repeat protein [Nitrospiria bacterium]|nr:tetratricopeptide repeat protein [Nitrospiria bacterium]
MSLINEALKKAERETEVGNAPEFAYPQKIFFSAGRQSHHRVLSLGLGALLLGALAVAVLQMPFIAQRLVLFGGSPPTPSVKEGRPVAPAVTGPVPSRPAGHPKELNQLIATGRSALHAGDMAAARSAFAKAAQLDPSSAVAQIGLGLVEKSAGRLAEAERYDLEAIRLDPDNAEAHNNLAMIYGQQGESSREIVEYTRALTLRPKYPEGHLNYAIALERLGRSAEAKAEYDKFLADVPFALSGLADRVRAHLSSLPPTPPTGAR